MDIQEAEVREVAVLLLISAFGALVWILAAEEPTITLTCEDIRKSVEDSIGAPSTFICTVEEK